MGLWERFGRYITLHPWAETLTVIVSSIIGSLFATIVIAVIQVLSELL